MFGRREKKHPGSWNPPPHQSPDSLALVPSLSANLALFQQLFAHVDTMVTREFQNQGNPSVRYAIAYSDGVAASSIINEYIIRPLLLSDEPVVGRGLFDRVKSQLVMVGELKETDSVKTIIEAVTYGDTLLFVDGFPRALLLNSKGFTLRSLAEPEGEKNLTGPREGFNEGLMTNLSLLRRRLRTNELKMRFYTVGRQTRTSLCICYMDNIVNHKILNELYRRLDGLDIDGVLDSNYLTEYITEQSPLGLSATGCTERPDVVVGKLLEGRIAILVDGSPAVLTIPYLFIENFQTSEDYYLNYVYASFSRILRIIGFALTVTVPALYIAVVGFQQELLPAALMIAVTQQRQNVPLPAALEAFLMLLIFDILRETGIRMPSHVGQALSVVGGLVIGQAAVEAKLVAAPIIIVVAFTGITNLLVPRLTPTTLICRYLFLFLATQFGLFGLLAGGAILVTHLLNLKSFGVSSLIPNAHLSSQEVKDTFVRAPWTHMRTRNTPLSFNRRRAARPGKGGGDA